MKCICNLMCILSLLKVECQHKRTHFMCVWKPRGNAIIIALGFEHNCTPNTCNERWQAVASSGKHNCFFLQFSEIDLEKIEIEESSSFPPSNIISLQSLAIFFSCALHFVILLLSINTHKHTHDKVARVHTACSHSTYKYVYQLLSGLIENERSEPKKKNIKLLPSSGRQSIHFLCVRWFVGRCFCRCRCCRQLGRRIVVYNFL